MLRYPAEVQSGDFVTLTPHEYRSNARGTNGPAVGPPIILYMPNSTPAMQNGQRWEKASFVGPFGEMKRDVAEAVVAFVFFKYAFICMDLEKIPSKTYWTHYIKINTNLQWSLF